MTHRFIRSGSSPGVRVPTLSIPWHLPPRGRQTLTRPRSNVNEPAPANRLEISFNSQGTTVDRTMEMLPQEDPNRFLQRCFKEVTEYFRFEWANWYRLQGEVETDWLSESSMFDLLKKRGS